MEELTVNLRIPLEYDFLEEFRPSVACPAAVLDLNERGAANGGRFHAVLNLDVMA